MNKRDQRKFALLTGAEDVRIAVDPDWFPEVDCIIRLTGDAYKASEGIRDGDLALVSLERQPKPGELVIADTPHDGRRVMRFIGAEDPFLRSDNPTIRDVALGEEGTRIIGTIVDTMRNPPFLRRRGSAGELIQVRMRNPS